MYLKRKLTLKTASVDVLAAMSHTAPVASLPAEVEANSLGAALTTYNDALVGNSVTTTYAANTLGGGILGTPNGNRNGRIYPPMSTGGLGGTLGGFVFPSIGVNPSTTITSSGSGYYTVNNSTSTNDVRKELESLCLNIEKYDLLEGTLKKMAQEFLEAIDKNTTLSGKNLLVYNTLRTHDVLIDKERFETIRKLQALTED